MKTTWLFLLILLSSSLNAAPESALDKRVAYNDRDKYRVAKAAHDGAGEIHIYKMFNTNAFVSKMRFLHAAVLPPKGGIGHHFHHKMEEVYVILDNEAEFTVNGRTSLLKGPVAVPCKMGQAHAIYNPSDKPTRFLNFAVSTVKDQYDAFNLGDDRVGVQIDPIPVFVSAPFDRNNLATIDAFQGGTGSVLYSCRLPSTVFSTNWNYADQVVIPAGSSIGPHKLKHIEELYYVMNGRGTVKVGDDSRAIRAGEAIPIAPQEMRSFSADGGEELELFVVGVALEGRKKIRKR